ncbi:putative cytosolic protein [Geobacillus sp. WSUCF1]|nr:putative cytosolic protein [Geobacillus sp. WSUCF1]
MAIGRSGLPSLRERMNRRTDTTKQALVTELLSLSGTVMLLYAAKDEQHNHAVVLREFLRNIAKEGFG